MKKMILVIAVSLSLLLTVGCDKETIISEQEIPTEVKVYISAHFPSSSIIRAIKEKGESERYEITLSEGFKLEFDSNNKIIDIDGPPKLPDSVIPSTIHNYVNSNYPGNHIIGWEIQSNNQEVQLNNSIELVFNMAGVFLRIGD